MGVVVVWQGGTSGAWAAAANWIGGVLPAHGDSVEFRGASLGANRCASGPAVVVLLNSIYADADYDDGVNATVCYDKCGMAGAPLASVTIDGDSRMADGHATVVTLNGDEAQILDGVVGTANLNGTDILCRVVLGTYDTVNLIGDNTRTAGAATIGTVNATGDLNVLAGLGCTITNLNMDGTNGEVSRVTATYVHLRGSGCYINSQDSVLSYVYVYNVDNKVSLTRIAADNITNGPFMCGWNQILRDHDTDEPIADMTKLPRGEGEW